MMVGCTYVTAAFELGRRTLHQTLNFCFLCAVKVICARGKDNYNHEGTHRGIAVVVHSDDSCQAISYEKVLLTIKFRKSPLPEIGGESFADVQRLRDQDAKDQIDVLHC